MLTYLIFSETQTPVTETDRPYIAPPSVTPSTSTTTQTSTQTSRPNTQTVRPSFMTKPIDGAPTLYSYRPPEVNLPSVDNLAAHSENSDIVNKITYNSVNKYQNVHRPSEETSPHNKISSSLSILSGARPMAVSEQHADNSISQGNLF